MTFRIPSLWQRIRFHCTDNQRPLSQLETDVIAVILIGCGSAVIGLLVGGIAR